MMAQKDGGPAFPLSDTFNGNGDWMHPVCPGMTLRDWFAGQALAVLGDGDACARQARTPEAEGMKPNDMIAALAYSIADAMLAERAK